jgi:hypothetical protein
MLVKPIFMLLGCSFNFSSDHPNAKVSVDVAVTGVPRGIQFGLEQNYWLFLTSNVTGSAVSRATIPSVKLMKGDPL